MPEPLILNIETATDVCSVALCLGEEVLALVESQTVNDHAAQLTTYIDQCMDKAGYRLGELDALAVSGGPGSYTSLRIGVATAKGICYALDKPLLAVPTLESLAHAARQIAVDQPTPYCP
ncbi:MAG: tRNA (adenosine(37)-N6)-threonylcarbamoyltransferase complex dimerization subunit type 1 TsaB [Saprospiraceae bacterium]|nr:tRNA (adenosine(37)-N6)-threonylcarbamoyltransferase complex dimerization subunit type 1 TsaB [Saprospiraceae bacterium]